jgi:AhpD family alkylhydroperoxidase
MSDVKKFYEDFQKGMGKAQQQAPDTVKSFMGLFQATMSEGKLSVKEKELIALAIGIAVRCEPCIYMHIKKCLDAGVTRDEILEAAQVVVMMQGGPGFVHLPMIIETLDALEA